MTPTELQKKAEEAYPTESAKKNMFADNQTQLRLQEAYIKGHQDATRWRDVKTELPEEDQIVMIETRGHIFLSRYKGKTFNRYNDHFDGDRTLSFFYTDPQLWMPLPEIPER